VSLTGTNRILVCTGSYSEPVPHAPTAHGKGLQFLEVDTATGDAVTVLEYDAVVNPAFVAVHPSMPVLYLMSESWTAPGSVAAVRFSADFRSVESMTQLATGGDVPSYTAVIGSYLVQSNYGDGSLAAFRLGPQGELVERTSLLALRGSGPDPERQDGPHAHCILPHPSNGFLYAADLGSDLVLRLWLDVDTGELVSLSETSVPPGCGPRHIVFSASGRTAFLVEELSSTLAVFEVDGAGDLVFRQRLSMLPPSYEGVSFGADIVLMPDGSRVFASNRGHNSVVMFEPDSLGEWRAVSWTPTGDIPRGLALTADGGHLLVANQESDSVHLLAVAPSGLVPVLETPLATPTCLRVLDPRG
jgi:6-phosphogluconolactonase